MEKLFILATFLCVLSTVRGDLVVHVENGDVQGSQMTSLKGRPYYAFRGIPYAQPPVGDLRFEPPVKASDWTGTYDGTKDANYCVQLGNGVVGDEDCLYIYVYTPQLPSNSSSPSLPVMAYIHGGGFNQGNCLFDSNRPDRFMDFDVVMVFISYRLGPFGFLNTGDTVSMGNYGLLDQNLGLQWIQNNVAAFGGDKSKVTIFGESAGGASVTYQLLSPASAGLFRAVISESGSSICPWAFQKRPRYYANYLASTMGCPTQNSTDLVNCLKQQSAADIVNALNSFNGYSLLEYPFVPSVEDPVYGRFLRQYPVEILEEGTFNKVPTISGINKDEGDSTYSMTQSSYDVIDDNFYNNILPSLIYNLTKYEKNLINVSYAVKAEYFDKIDVTNHTQVIRTAIDFNSDPFFKSSTDWTIRMLAKYQVPAYMYSFEYAGSSSGNHFSGEPEVSHADELAYLFYNPYITFNANDQYIADHMTSMWVNFATQLNPTPDGGDYVWTPTPFDENVNYLKIDTNNLSMQTGYITERMQFWENVVPVIVAS